MTPKSTPALTDDEAAALGLLDDDALAALTALTDDDRTALADLSDDDRTALAELHDEHEHVDEPAKKAEPVKKAAAKKAAAPRKEAAPKPHKVGEHGPELAQLPASTLVEPAHPAIDHDAYLAAGYHPPTVPAVAADVDERIGFKVAEPDDHATQISFDDGTTYAVDPDTGRIAERI